MRRAATFGLVLILLVGAGLVLSCEGPAGPQGLQGEQGEQGPQGLPGSNGVSPFIGTNGNWWIGTTDTGIAAKGADGATGANGTNGTNGTNGIDGTQWAVGQNGNWWIGDQDSGIRWRSPSFPLNSTYADKPRLIVTTDPEMDDLSSLLHMLLYANEINIIGLIVSDSQWHYRGYADGRQLPAVTQAARNFGYRWPGTDNDLPQGNSPGAANDGMHIDLALKAYRDAYPYLVKHDSNYPPPYKLENMVYYGCITGDFRIPENSGGSDFIASILLDNVPGKVFVQGWGGLTTVSRALRRIRTTSQFSTRAQPGGDLYEKITGKLVVSSFGFQELGGGAGQTAFHEIGKWWPDVEYRQVSQQIWGYSHGSARWEEHAYLSNGISGWTQQYVMNVGPHGSSYWMVGTQGRSTEFDNDNRRWLITNAETAEDQRYGAGGANAVYGAFISEGDSSNWALLVDNGLRNWVDPAWGGWGGRQVKRTDFHTGFGSGNLAVSLSPFETAPAYTEANFSTAQINSGQAAAQIELTATVGRGVNPSKWWTNSVQDTWSTFASAFVRDLATGRDQNDSAGARWFPYWWRSFANRLKWSISAPEDCNHNPNITVTNNIAPTMLDFVAAAGASVTLTASVSDPDGDAVNVTWWHYIEAGTYGGYGSGGATTNSYTGDLALAPSANGLTCTFTVPAGAVSGDTIHIIAEATDNYDDPELNLTSWERIVITVQ